MSLSERFSKLKSQKVANGRVSRQTSQINSGKDKRSQQTQGKRGIDVSRAPNATKNNNAKGGKRPIKVGQANIKGGKKNQKNVKKTGKDAKGKREDKAPATQPDLDKDMDSYWFKAGKGPDPQLASLDRDMDAYFQGKAAAEVAAPQAAAVESVPMAV